MDSNWNNESLDDLASDELAAENQPTLERPALAGLRILLVEDDLPARQLLSDILAVDAGAEVMAVASIREALAALEQQPIDVLISNIILPDGDGCMLIRQIRTLSAEQGGQIPAIAVTAAANERNRTELLAAGFQDYLFKPFDVERLIASVANLARLHRDR
jgi:CheY-like chemotaxis protein